MYIVRSMTSKMKKIERTQLIPFRFCSQACKRFVIRIENQPHWQNGKKVHLRRLIGYKRFFANQYLMQNMPISEKHCS